MEKTRFITAPVPFVSPDSMHPGKWAVRISSLVGTTPVGNRLTRGKPLPDLQWEDLEYEVAVKNSQALREYIEEGETKRQKGRKRKR